MFVDWNELNYIAVAVGGILYMMYGGIYYSILLGDKKGATKERGFEAPSQGPLKYVVSVVIAFISSFLVASIVQAMGLEGLGQGLTLGLSIGTIITLVYLKNSLFGLVNRKAFLIAIGDHLVIFTLLGALHGFMA